MKKKILLPIMAVLFLGLGACSKKEVTEEGDAAGDITELDDEFADGGMGAGGGVAPGTKIPELGSVYFAYDSFELNSESQASLDAAAEWLKMNPSQMIQIEGHTDERGTTEYNLALGERRAGAARDYLVMMGVPASQITTISYGEERPSAVGSNEEAWAQNRRSEFVAAGY